ncbi:hypothetical protein ST47_g1944 [Ascochyta rabiei]|uniref:Uncharacterized protein n=1 Tax=Didymella rabiei TaxID=5454 RepID=A0A163KCA8_DIDRA|nr:hypothetical protein ST47_g1944 [Ascochyta rabiei]
MEDYYMVLGVAPSATPELITRAYKQLALKLHPDRNTNQDATQAFQLLSRAYETLRDEIKRREYDRIFPSIKRDYAFPRNTQTPRPFPTSTPQSEALSEAAQIAALNKSKQERAARWKINKSVLDSSIFDLQRQISRVEQEIKNLNNIAATEAAVERQKNSWGTWLLSPIIKHAEESDEDKARKDREKQERRIEKDMKERRLETMQTDMRGREARLKQAKSEADAAIMSDDEKIRNIQAKTRARELQKQRERARVEREKMEEIRRQQQEQRVKCEQEVAEVLRKQMRNIEGTAKPERIERTTHNLVQTLTGPSIHPVATTAPVATSAGGRKCKVVQHVHGVARFGPTCCSVRRVVMGWRVQNVKLTYGRGSIEVPRGRFLRGRGLPVQITITMTTTEH